jgi:hypothetical protein
MITLDTPQRRVWFAVACIWFLAWTAAYALSAMTPAGFKPVGWFMFAVVPILAVWGLVSGFSRLRRWIKSGA